MLYEVITYLNPSVHDLGPKPLQQAANAQLEAGLTAETIWPGKRGLEGQKVWRDWVSRVVQGAAEPAQAMAQAKVELAPLLAA